MSKMTQNTLLAITDGERSQYRNLIADYNKHFSKNQGDYRGERKTHVASEGWQPDTSRIGFTSMVTTVGQKLNYFVSIAGEILTNSLTQERTNAMSCRTAPVKIGSVTYELTGLELLRLKSFLEKAEMGNLGDMISNIPTRDTKKRWKLTTDSEFIVENDPFGVYQGDLETGETRTTTKTYQTLPNPDAATMAAKGLICKNETVPIDVREKTGDYTYQEFSGAITHPERVAIINRLQELIKAVTIALKEVNDVEITQSPLDGNVLLNYLFFNK